MTVWYFNGKVDGTNIASGLSVIYHTIWAAEGSRGALRLTTEERRIARILEQPGTPVARKSLAKLLNKSNDLLKQQLQGIYDKGKQLTKKNPDIQAGNLHELARYLHDHPEEYAFTPGEIGI
jgi:transposase InsO family protein